MQSLQDPPVQVVWALSQGASTTNNLNLGYHRLPCTARVVYRAICGRLSTTVVSAVCPTSSTLFAAPEATPGARNSNNMEAPTRKSTWATLRINTLSKYQSTIPSLGTPPWLHKKFAQQHHWQLVRMSANNQCLLARYGHRQLASSFACRNLRSVCISCQTVQWARWSPHSGCDLRISPSWLLPISPTV